MDEKSLPRIADVAPGNVPLSLQVRWCQGEASLIDISGLVEAFRVYEPLRQDSALFRQVRVGEHGTDVVWTDVIDMSADTLWRLARDQAGARATTDGFHSLRERKA